MNTKSTTSKKTAATPVESAVASSQDAVEQIVKAGTENYEKAFTTAKARVDDAVKSYDQFALFGKENMEAFIAAGNLYAKGWESLTAELLAFSKQNVEDSVAATKAMMSAKTVQEMWDLQTTFARSWMDGMVNESTKVGEIASKLTTEAMEPISARMTASAEVWKKVAA